MPIKSRLQPYPPTVNQVPVGSHRMYDLLKTNVCRIVWIFEKCTMHGTVHAMQQLTVACLWAWSNNHSTYTYTLCSPITKQKLYATTRNNGGDTVVLTGTFARKEYWYINHLLGAGRLSKQPVVLDVWATIGDLWLLLKYLWCDSFVIAVEWDPEAAEIARDNFERNSINGEVIGKPITADGREVIFDNQSITTRRKILSSWTWVTLDSTTLPEVMQEFSWESIDLCKIDIEWGEFELLTEENKPHFNRMKHIILEYHTSFAQFENDIASIQAYFGDNFSFQREQPILKKWYNWWTIIWLVYMEKI